MVQTQYLFSFKDKVQATTFYTVAKNGFYTDVAYVGDYSTVVLTLNLNTKQMAKHIKDLKQGNFGITKVKVIN